MDKKEVDKIIDELNNKNKHADYCDGKIMEIAIESLDNIARFFKMPILSDREIVEILESKNKTTKQKMILEQNNVLNLVKQISDYKAFIIARYDIAEKKLKKEIEKIQKQLVAYRFFDTIKQIELKIILNKKSNYPLNLLITENDINFGYHFNSYPLSQFIFDKKTKCINYIFKNDFDRANMLTDELEVLFLIDLEVTLERELKRIVEKFIPEEHQSFLKELQEIEDRKVNVPWK